VSGAGREDLGLHVGAGEGERSQHLGAGRVVGAVRERPLQAGAVGMRAAEFGDHVFTRPDDGRSSARREFVGVVVAVQGTGLRGLLVVGDDLLAGGRPGLVGQRGSARDGEGDGGCVEKACVHDGSSSRFFTFVRAGGP